MCGRGKARFLIMHFTSVSNGNKVQTSNYGKVQFRRWFTHTCLLLIASLTLWHTHFMLLVYLQYEASPVIFPNSFVETPDFLSALSLTDIITVRISECKSPFPYRKSQVDPDAEGAKKKDIWCDFVIHKHNHDYRLAHGRPGDTQTGPHTYNDFPQGSLSATAEHMSLVCCPSGTLTGRHLETPVSWSHPCFVIPRQVSVHACTFSYRKPDECI